jgi:hypothetical protein
MNKLDRLLRGDDPAWPEVRRWLNLSPRSVEILPVDRKRGELNLLHLQASLDSALGAVAYETGGILLDGGWLRILGSGSDRMRGDFVSWNTSREDYEAFRGGIIVAFDVAGGFFAINAGAFPGELGDIFYFAPDTLTWESVSMTYSHFLYWAANGDLPGFCQRMRWPGWENEVAALDGANGVSIYPPLWANAVTPLLERSRKVVPMVELWGIEHDIARQIAKLPDGSTVRIKVED